MTMFETFLDLLNSIRPSIQFTFELSRTERIVPGQPDLPADVTESLPFLELDVMCKTVYIGSHVMVVTTCMLSATNPCPRRQL